MKAGDVRKAAEALLHECLDIIEERGKQYGNASLEEVGMLTGRSPDDILMSMVEVKLNRIKNDIIASPCRSVDAKYHLKRDTVVDLINYLAFLQGRQDASA